MSHRARHKWNIEPVGNTFRVVCTECGLKDQSFWKKTDAIQRALVLRHSRKNAKLEALFPKRRF